KKNYVGITTTSFKERKQNHISHRNVSNLPVHNALVKYKGEVEWKVIDEANDWIELCNLEKKYIKQYKSHISKEGYNLTVGGDGTLGYKHTSINNKNNSARRKEYFKDEINRIKQSEANIKAHKENPNLGKEHSKVMKDFYSDGSESKKRRKEMQDYLSVEENLIKHSRQRGAKEFLVYDINNKFIGEWLTQSQCGRDLKLSVSKINLCLHGKRNTHGGYRFRYKDLK
ncbi:hypothetical protein N8148_03120, partial [Gammaproteobacteria bacterium]|nr:hypothetical protein [Gammaproteobacteria bacterium]